MGGHAAGREVSEYTISDEILGFGLQKLLFRGPGNVMGATLYKRVERSLLF